MLVETAKASGFVSKRVTCEKCRCAYRYDLTRARIGVSFVPLFMALLTLPMLCLTSRFAVFSAGGFAFFRWRLGGPSMFRSMAGKQISGGGEDGAVASQRRLRKALLHGVEPVPCPECGWYQRDMVKEVRSRFLPALVWAAGIVLIASQPGVFLVHHYTTPGRRFDVLTIWFAVSAAAVMGAVFLMLVRWLVSLGVNPNAGYPSPRDAYPDAPAAVRESDLAAEVAARVQRLSQIQLGKPSLRKR
jgi:hypothetical protein